MFDGGDMRCKRTCKSVWIRLLSSIPVSVSDGGKIGENVDTEREKE